MSWYDEAACRGADAEAFYPIGEGAVAAWQAQQVVTEYCRVCPVRSACLAAADDFGIWGGFTEKERRSIKRREYRASQAEKLSVVGLNMEPEPEPRPIKDSAYVPVEPIRVLLQGAKDSGFKVQEIAAMCGVHADTIWALLARKQDRITYRVARKVEARFAKVEAR